MLRSFMIALMFACIVINLVCLIANLAHGNPFSLINAVGLVASVYSFNLWLMTD